MPSNNEIISRDPQTRLSGRLIALPSSAVIQAKNLEETEAVRKAISIDFPAMPDSLEMARQTDYAVTTNTVLPDGVHQYRGTRPLTIPFSFKLHAMDRQYCPEGALTLIKVAGRLHSFVLPVSDKPSETNLVTPPITQTKKGQKAEGEADHDADSNENAFRLSAGGNLYPPVTCWLHLMYLEDEQPGISCVGYVSEVSAKFQGPWMRGNESEFNLPSSCEFSFTFVHLPNHGNAFEFRSSALQPITNPQTQAYAHTVKDRFFNTRNLVVTANFRGFD